MNAILWKLRLSITCLNCLCIGRLSIIPLHKTNIYLDNIRLERNYAIKWTTHETWVYKATSVNLMIKGHESKHSAILYYITEAMWREKYLNMKDVILAHAYTTMQLIDWNYWVC